MVGRLRDKQTMLNAQMDDSNRTLSRECFVAPTIFDWEQNHLFAKNWLCIGRATDFESGICYRVQIGSFDLIVAREKGASELYVFHNVCRHRGTRLVSDQRTSLRNGGITCPYHAWTYDARGALIGAPNMSDSDNFCRKDFGLNQVACRTWLGFVFVQIDDGATVSNADLFEKLGSRLHNWSLDGLTTAATLAYKVMANWKIIFQNYSECYHCPTVHPRLNQLTPYKSASNDLIAGNVLGGPMALDESCETVSQNGKFAATPIDTLDADQLRKVFYYTVFPTMFISAHPDYVMVHYLKPVAEDQTEVRCEFLVAEPDANHQLASAIEFWDEVNRQDWQVCELTQNGVSSPGYIPGPYSPLESMVKAFDGHYRLVTAGSDEHRRVSN
jgi:Rieske 2Fe-2S family protein